VTPPAVRIDNVSKRFRNFKERRHSLKEVIVRRSTSRFDEFWALRDVTLDIERGSTFGLIGHNGSGKSTLLKLMAHIHRPTSGTVTVDGRLSALLELGAGFHPELTGRENIRLNGAILGLSSREIDRAMPDIIEFSGLEQFIDSPVKIYSSGMYVRLGFSVAVHVRPDVLLIDEVIAVGDEDFQRRCFDHLYGLRAQGATVVLVSHSLGLVQSFCDQAAWLDHGQLKALGRSDQVVESYLRSVNAGESGRAEPEASDNGSSRHGSGEILIEDVSLLDASGRPVGFAVAGEPLAIRLHYRSDHEVARPVFGLGFHHESGANVASANTRFQGLEVPSINGRGHIDYVFDHCPLNPGSYQLDVVVSDETMTRTYDGRSRLLELKVRQGSGPQREGLVELAGRFTAAT
jgi:ABC-2 type transport system ATP-binding protein/lipopolysaccharide transport system ATP-binding protein